MEEPPAAHMVRVMHNGNGFKVELLPRRKYHAGFEVHAHKPAALPLFYHLLRLPRHGGNRFHRTRFIGNTALFQMSLHPCLDLFCGIYEAVSLPQQMKARAVRTERGRRHEHFSDLHAVFQSSEAADKNNELRAELRRLYRLG